MKKILIFLGTISLLASCKPKPEGEQGEAFSKIDGMNGAWQISAFKQRDESSPIKEVRDLSEFYIVDGSAATHITFNSSDRTYMVVPGPGRNYFGTTGTWAFDNDEFPTSLTLFNAADTSTLSLGTAPREFDTHLQLELPRYCVDVLGVAAPTVTYIFQIERVQ